jgi:hypothetical protein
MAEVALGMAVVGLDMLYYLFLQIDNKKHVSL